MSEYNTVDKIYCAYYIQPPHLAKRELGVRAVSDRFGKIFQSGRSRKKGA